MNAGFRNWYRSGTPYVWLNAGAVSISILLVIGLLLLIAVRGLGHFWPGPVADFTFQEGDGSTATMIGEMVQRETVPRARVLLEDSRISDQDELINRSLIKIGNRDFFGTDFRWILDAGISDLDFPSDLMTVERREWGNFYGYLVALRRDGESLPAAGDLWDTFQQHISESTGLYREIRHIEEDLIGDINYRMERLRLELRRLELQGRENGGAISRIRQEQAGLKEQYDGYSEQLAVLYERLNRDTFVARIADGREVELPVAQVVRAFRSNDMNLADKAGFYLEKIWEFVSDDPREANTEGGVYPAIFGTIMMVLIMAVLVTPFGVIAAVYLREYARQGLLVRIIRIAVNNLAGVPSVVYGVFGLGFFVYFLGGNIDELFFRASLPSPTFGTPGLLWASLTLAILTVPVVIVSTEEGLSRVPREIREGSLALGATRAETLMRTVLPMTAPAMMTGLILAIARAAGEVAPLMLVGVVKLAPSLPVDGNFPYLHLERKFMHLGFHIYDVGFQSPNVEAARPLVYATALLLVLIIVVLNLAAIHIRNSLREKYRASEQH